MPVPSKLLYCAVPEFDRLRAAARSGQGSSSGAGKGSSSSAGSSSHAMVRREPLEKVKGYDVDAFVWSLSPLDFVPENAVDVVVASFCEWSTAEEVELQAQRRHDLELNNVLPEKSIATSLSEPVPVVSSDEE